MNLAAYLVSILVPWILKMVLYHFAFRWRHIHATFQTKLIVAGAPMLVRGLLWPFPLPAFIFFLIAAGAGIYLCKQYTDGKLFPDIVGIVAGIEIISLVLIDGLIIPMLI